MKKLHIVFLTLLIALAASCKGGGVSKPFIATAGGTSQPVIPASWRVANWFFDPANSSGTASDGNDCQTSSTPCLTWGEIFVHRLGAGCPVLQQPTVFNQLSAQTLNVDNIFGTFCGANGAQAALKGQLTSVGTIPINTATVTTQVRGGPGTRWQVTNMPGGTAAKNLLQDTTQNTWSTIDSLAVNTATISQPETNATVMTVGIPTLTAGSMATNDAFTVWSQPLSNLKVWTMNGGDVGVGGANSAATTAWVQGVEIADSSGTGASEFAAGGQSAVTVFSLVRFDPRVVINSMQGRGRWTYFATCDITGAMTHIAGLFGLSGGVNRGGFTSEGGAAPTVSEDAVLHGANLMLGGGPIFQNVFADGTTTVLQATVQMTGVFWGSGPVTIDPGGSWVNETTNFVTGLLTSGALKFGTNTTGFTSPVCGTFTNNGVTQVDTTPAGGAHWPAGASFSWSLNTVGGTACATGGPYFSAAVTQDNLFTKAVTANCNDIYNYCALPTSVSITAANIDLFSGLQDINTGARFSNLQ